MNKEPISGFQFRYPRHVQEFPEIFHIINKNADKNLKIILLKRRNKLKGAISQQNAEKIKISTGKAHLFKSASTEVEPLNLDIDRALKEAQLRQELDDEYLAWAKSGFDFIEIFYEDLCESPEMEVNRILQHLGCSSLIPGGLKESDLIKVTSNNLGEAIKNHIELRDCVLSVGNPEWLDKNSNCIKPSVSIERFKNGTLLYKIKLKMKSGGFFNLKIERLRIKTNTKFLEYAAKVDETIICSEGNSLKVSSDNCKSWKKISSSTEYKKCFTTFSGVHLLQSDTGRIYRYTKDWKFLGYVETGQSPWHGSWSIDQDPQSNVILWCEYPYAAAEVNVWRSYNDGETWERCFFQKGHPTDPKKGTIRHFHLVQKCETYLNRWYLSSGDTENQSKFWFSDNNGDSWSCINIDSITGDLTGIPKKIVSAIPPLHRYGAAI